ncbi:DNA replication/repair protein RecF [Asaia krungthepensis]|uniref:DNA replication and repair protein RecF n=1 Tax=Asaia krungthepensis NRIC 0535 TaxID=1307925 RepID=A0ABQ0PXY1_9PROT|nr:DNA replication/repair protein RecF [Asaia krungthepensis]GBQ84328.1 recombination protein F [Asaia krungthepensis NRIC 0535]
MQISRLVLTDFRNYERLAWSPQSRLVVLTGENGAGKTNLLEALSLLAPGRGLRGASNAQIQRQNGGAWGVVARLGAGTLPESELATGTDPANPVRRVFRLNGGVVRNQGEIAPYFAATWLTPQMDRLFTDPASGRRRFLDRLVLSLDPNHARESAAHERAVTQRNRLLVTRPDQGSWLDALEDSIARHAIAMTASRLSLIEAMNHAPHQSAGEFPAARLRLLCDQATALSSRSALQVEDDLRGRLKASRDDDAARGATSCGAHRADFQLEDAQSARPAALSSSGQQKAMLVHVILNHASVVMARSGAAPMILLDEPLNHLDARRRSALLHHLKDRNISAMLTGTEKHDFAALGREVDHRHVEQGHFLA